MKKKAISINYNTARDVLDRAFREVETDFTEGRPSPKVPDFVADACTAIFQSETQSYREALLGCIVAKCVDRRVNVRHPYISQGSNAFSGRRLDEKVINPFLQTHKIPASRGAYLAVFRRSVEFVPQTRAGLRDQKGYDAFLKVLGYLENIEEDDKLDVLLKFVLRKFIELRQGAQVLVQRLQRRLSLPQYNTLVTKMLAIRSGGRFPVLLVQAAVLAMKEAFNLDWEIIVQGINVADRPAGVSGDITIRRNSEPVLVIEVTERPVAEERLVTTFEGKIAPAKLTDYIFVQGATKVPANVLKQAQQYFAQGYDVSFVEIRSWILNVLAAIGRNGRDSFLRKLQDLIDSPEISSALKTQWNALIAEIV